jgi:Tfp pilus assembly protein FimT
LVECLVVVALLGLIAAATVPPVAAALERSRTLAAARFLQSRMMLARAQAVSRGAVVALRLTGVPGDTTLSTLLDGNRNGVLQADIGSGIDVPTGRPAALAALFRGITFSPVATGGTLLSFSPIGTSSSGTITVEGRDGARFAVRLLGATGRARVLRYDWIDGSWSEVL